MARATPGASSEGFFSLTLMRVVTWGTTRSAGVSAASGWPESASARNTRAIAIAVEGDAERDLVAGIGDRLGNDFGMQRAAAGVNVAAVGLGVHEFGGNAAPRQQLGRKRAGGAVGAVHQHMQPFDFGA